MLATRLKLEPNACINSSGTSTGNGVLSSLSSAVLLLGNISKSHNPEDIFNPENTTMPNDWVFRDEFVVIYHGAIEENRRLKELILAMRQTDDNICLFLLGGGSILDELKELSESEKLKKRIYFHPVVPYRDVPKYLKAANVGIIPIPDSLWFKVSMPIKLLEYMAMGLPVIAPRVQPINEVLEKGGDLLTYKVCGEKVNSVDVTRAINRAYKLWGKNGLSIRNRLIVLKKYSWKIQAENIHKYLCNL